MNQVESLAASLWYCGAGQSGDNVCWRQDRDRAGARGDEHRGRRDRRAALYNADLHQSVLPPKIRQLCERTAATDALLFVTPEYNYSIPAPLKNAL